ncbi:MAG: hypothetical protein JEZ08_00935 [Clostridiales bacterium]|nr:hypothetical protein [Clostridiales bacterium]
MKKVLLVFLSLSPFVLGKFLSDLMITTDIYGSGVTLYGMAFLTLWFVIGITSFRLSGSIRESVIYGHIGGFISLLMMFLQTIILGRFFSNSIGFYTQMYFMPTLRIGGFIEEKLLFFVKTHFLMPVSFISLAIMISVYALGYKVAENRSLSAMTKK